MTRVHHVALVLVLAVAAGVTTCAGAPAYAGSLRAEPPAPVIRKNGTHMRSKPRRSAATIAVVAAGRPVKIVKRTKLWLKVKVGRKTGWVERAAVGTAPVAAAPAPAPAPAPKAVPVGTPRPRERHAAAWGRNQMGEGAPAPAADEPAPAGDEPATLRVPAHRLPALGLELDVGAGVAARRSSFSSDGTSPFANHRFDQDALAFEAGARYMRGRRLVVGADTRVVHHRSAPGVHFTAPDGQSQTIALQDWRVTSVAVAGLRASRAAAFAARAGYEYEFLDVADLMNLATIGREIRRGPLVGLGVMLADAGGTTVHAEVDLLVAGSLTQTQGREDGTPGTVFKARAGAGIAFPLGRGLALRVDYRFSDAYTTFTAPSSRHTGLTHGERSEREHDLLVAVGWGL